MKFFITGIGGFIGTWLMKTLVNASGIDSKDCDVRDYNKLKKIIQKDGPSHIIHLAAIANPKTCKNNPELAWSVNVKGTENVLRIGKELGIKTIVMSSAKVYKQGNNSRENDELKEDGDNYVKTKIETERLAREYNAIIIRPFNQEGPGRPKEYFTSKVILAAINGTPLELWNPKATREYMDVRDGIKGIQIISEKGTPGEAYNLCTGEGLSKLEYIKQVEEVLKKKVDYKVIKDEDKSILIGNNTKLKSLGWKQEYTIKQTIKDQIDYLKNKKQ